MHARELETARFAVYGTFLVVHSHLRWLIFLGFAWVLLRALLGRFGVSKWSAHDTVAMRSTVIGLDVQFVLGLMLYTFLSPLTQAAFDDMGAAMKDRTLRFFAVEHIFGMVVAVGLAHVGSVRVKRAAELAAKAKQASVWFTLSAAVLLASIPWWRL